MSTHTSLEFNGLLVEAVGLVHQQLDFLAALQDAVCTRDGDIGGCTEGQGGGGGVPPTTRGARPPRPGDSAGGVKLVCR
jgi:hypothetical protein